MSVVRGCKHTEDNFRTNGIDDWCGVCQEDWYVDAKPPKKESPVLKLVKEQAEDDGLWFQAQTASEAYLQQELRRLHKAVEEKSSG